MHDFIVMSTIPLDEFEKIEDKLTYAHSCDFFYYTSCENRKSLANVMNIIASVYRLFYDAPLYITAFNTRAWYKAGGNLVNYQTVTRHPRFGSTASDIDHADNKLSEDLRPFSVDDITSAYNELAKSHGVHTIKLG